MYGKLTKIDKRNIYIEAKQKKGAKKIFILCEADAIIPHVTLNDIITFTVKEEHIDEATGESWVIQWQVYKINDIPYP